MPSGVRETFRIILYLDFDQKKVWERVHSEAVSIYQLCGIEIETDLKNLGGKIAENHFLEIIKKKYETKILDETAWESVVLWSYNNYRSGKRAGRVFIPVKIDPSSVSFSTINSQVRLPYLGLVRHGRNNFIIPGETTGEDRTWLLANIRGVYLDHHNNDICLVFDCSEMGAGRQRKKFSKKKKLPGLLE